MRFRPVSYLRFWLSLPIALFAALGVHAQGVHVESTPYPTVTDERLLHPDTGDWLMYRRTYDGLGFSPLKQITPGNVRRLTLAWSVSTDLLGAHETTPIVNRGRMFITTPQNNIIALEDRNPTVAVCPEVPGRPVPAASDKPRRRALR
jgi:alcohol dehydrogenase (cytochrome c)